MSDLYGCLNPVSRENLSALEACQHVNGRERPDIVIQQGEATVTLSDAPKGQYFRNEHGIIAILGQLHSPYRHTPEPLEQLLIKFRQQGPSVLEQCEGQFALCIVLPASKTVFLATDCLGSYPLHYQVDAEGLLFCSKPMTLTKEEALEPQALIQYLTLNVVPPYASWPVLNPGHYLLFRQGQCLEQPYRLQQRHGTAPAGHYIQRKRQFKRLLQSNIQSSGSAAELSVCHLGCQSSAYLTRILETMSSPAPIHLFSICYEGDRERKVLFDRLYKDKGFQIEMCSVSPEQFLSHASMMIKRQNEPLGYLPAVSTSLIAAHAFEKGYRSLLSPEGAKTLFVHSNRYAFEDEASSQKNLFSRLLGRLYPAKNISDVLLSLSRIEQSHWINQLGQQEIFQEAFLATADCHAPYELLQSGYAQSRSQTHFGKLQSLSFQFRLSFCQLRQTRLAVAHSGVSIFYAFLSDALVDFANHLPDQWKIEDPNKPAFFNRQVQKYFKALPDTPIVPPLSLWLQDSASFRKVIASKFSLLAKHGIFQERFLEKILLQGYPGLQPVENGLLWLLLSLSLWLESHESSVAQGSYEKETISVI